MRLPPGLSSRALKLSFQRSTLPSVFCLKGGSAIAVSTHLDSRTLPQLCQASCDKEKPSCDYAQIASLQYGHFQDQSVSVHKTRQTLQKLAMFLKLLELSLLPTFHM